MTALEMFNKLILPRLAAEGIKSAVPIVTAINTSVDWISAQLIDRKSDLVQMPMNLIANKQKLTLPDDFGGLFSAPVFNNNFILDPLDPTKRHEYAGKTGTPEAYEIKGVFMFLYPTPATSGTITAEYYVNAEQLAGMFDEVPFYGKFDHLIADTCIKLAVKGTGLITEPAFAAEINMTLDRVLLPRQKMLPQRRAVHYF